MNVSTYCFRGIRFLFCFLESPKFLPRKLRDLGTVNQEAIIWLKELKFQISLTPDNIMESVSVLDVTNAKTSRLTAIFLSCHSTRFSRVSASGLKEFYCPKYNMPLSGPHNTEASSSSSSLPKVILNFFLLYNIFPNLLLLCSFQPSSGEFSF